MPFVATEEQVKAFQAFSHRPGFSQEVIAVDFETTPEFVKSVLPPGLEPAIRPVGTVSLSTWESKLCGEFECTMVSLQAVHDGVEGKYILTLIVSGDTPVTWGREIWGEIKKTGVTKLFRSGHRRSGFGERNGVRLVEMRATFDEDLPPNVEESIGYEIKAYPSSTGIGLHDEPRLLKLNITDHNTVRAEGKGTLILRGTTSDPLHDIPIKSIDKFKYVSGVADYFVLEEKPLGIGNAYLPYLIGRHYDDLRAFQIGADFDKTTQIEHKVSAAREFTSL
ncbi:hypothetical protein PFICI_02274 [Pestalotiopsis fici W106-1]|uniref:Acetoacetate decarboxylase n=1 Tax=Pestalotiopsis fici (strain W106-1 / CGMCC3.15140) TaxID=1229662 RepID=W3XE21_PESFW|nr:uncharacterized protein PFICI_02274 [Pestalotiopsis fici W106-1]ETS84249.1 hypothetical protein PFICI_02274 [Pestalotiopsis fici W106-1]